MAKETKKTTVKKKTTPKKKTTAKKKVTPKKVTKKTTVKKATTRKTTTKSTVKKATPKKTTSKVKTTSPKKTVRKTTSKKKVTKQEVILEDIKKKVKLNKRQKRKIIFNSIFTIILLAFIYYIGFYISPTPIIKSVYIDDDNNMVVKFNINSKRHRNKIYCLYKTNDEVISINDEDWFLTSNNECIYPIEPNNVYYTYLKNEDNYIYNVNSNKTGRVYNLKTQDVVYLPIKGTHEVKLTYDSIGFLDNTVTYEIENDSILSIKDNIISGLKDGTSKVKVKIMNAEIDINVTVTSLITIRKQGEFDFSKPDLPCKKYTKEQNELLDTILKYKIENVGYKTRAGVVEAARFLTLDFPYRITYFYENGRQTTNNVDGEGRYYHKGLYLNSSKFSSITGSKKGPQIWGCSLYSVPDKKTDINGLDCSGFVSWVLLNGGFDVKDVGAGWSNNLDLTDYGTVKKVTTTLTSSDQIKVGDLHHSTRLGGHIGIIVGLDKTYYYVAQAIWYNPVGVVITKIQRNKLANDFPHVILMDKYYKKDGNLTNMW